MRFIREPVSSRPSTVEPRELALGAADLLVGDAVLGDPVELVAADLQHVVDLARAAAGVDAEQAGCRRSRRCRSRRE